VAEDPVTQRDWADAQLINAAIDVHTGDPEFGYRLISDELREHGHTASENRGGRLCSQQRIYSAFAKRKGAEQTRAGGPRRPGAAEVHRRIRCGSPTSSATRRFRTEWRWETFTSGPS